MVNGQHLYSTFPMNKALGNLHLIHSFTHSELRIQCLAQWHLMKETAKTASLYDLYLHERKCLSTPSGSSSLYSSFKNGKQKTSR